MEGFPHIRIVGNADEETKEGYKKQHIDSMDDPYAFMSKRKREALQSVELEKTPFELKLIETSNAITNRLMKKVGVEPHDLPEANFHFVPAEYYNKQTPNPESPATAYPSNHSILLNADYLREKPFPVAIAMVHELLHIKAHQTWHVKEEADGRAVASYRTGMTTYAPIGAEKESDREHFLGLHEAIVTTEQMKATSELLELPEFQDEKLRLESEDIKALKKIIAQNKNIPESEIAWIGKDEHDFLPLGYSHARKVLQYIVHEIYDAHQGEFLSEEDVYNEFLRAHFTGELLPTARLVEETFGKGSFRILGQVGFFKASAEKSLKTLQAAREKVKQGQE